MYVYCTLFKYSSLLKYFRTKVLSKVLSYESIILPEMHAVYLFDLLMYSNRTKMIMITIYGMINPRILELMLCMRISQAGAGAVLVGRLPALHSSTTTFARASRARALRCRHSFTNTTRESSSATDATRGRGGGGGGRRWRPHAAATRGGPASRTT